MLDVLSDNDKALVRFCFGTPTQERLDDLLSRWDIEREGARKALILSYTKKKFPFLAFPPYCGPRLDGVLEYFRFWNLRLISRYNCFLAALSERKIPFLPIGDLSMKGLYPDFSRKMDVLEILVGDEAFENVVKLATDFGFACRTDRRGAFLCASGTGSEGMVIRHSPFLYSMRCDDFCESLFSRAESGSVFGVECLIPSREDLCFILLRNLVYGLMDRSRDLSILMALYDLKCLISDRPGIDWNIVYEDARCTSSDAALAYAARFIDTIVPGLLPGGMRNVAGRWRLRYFANYVKMGRKMLLPLAQQSAFVRKVAHFLLDRLFRGRI